MTHAVKIPQGAPLYEVITEPLLYVKAHSEDCQTSKLITSWSLSQVKPGITEPFPNVH